MQKCTDFEFKYTRNHFAAELRPDPLGLQTLQGGRFAAEEKKRRRGRERSWEKRRRGKKVVPHELTELIRSTADAISLLREDCLLYCCCP